MLFWVQLDRYVERGGLYVYGGIGDATLWTARFGYELCVVRSTPYGLEGRLASTAISVSILYAVPIALVFYFGV
jgi:hypothetical protein